MIIPFGPILTAFLALLDLKEWIFFGKSTESYEKQRSLPDVVQFDADKPSVYYTNPVIAKNTPDPGVIKLVDGSGWVVITTSNHASRDGDNSAFPIYHSTGDDGL